MDSEALGNIGGSVISIAILVLAVSAIAWPVLRGREWLMTRANKNIERLMAQFNLSNVSQEGFVLVNFPVYVGVLITVTEISHQIWVPRKNVRQVINSLALLSFKFGLFTILAPYIIFMVFLNYVLHLRKIINN